MGVLFLQPRHHYLFIISQNRPQISFSIVSICYLSAFFGGCKQFRWGIHIWEATTLTTQRTKNPPRSRSDLVQGLHLHGWLVLTRIWAYNVIEVVRKHMPKLKRFIRECWRKDQINSRIFVELLIYLKINFCLYIP